MDIGPVQHHPLATKVHAIQAHKAQPAVVAAPKPSAILKQEAISHALAQAPSRKEQDKSHAKHQKRQKRGSSRTLSLASAALSLVLLAGYFTYINMPSLSVRVAAAQSGIDASYPAFRPDGYKLDGPVAYSNGQVDIKFAATAGPQNFSIKQARSSWDSSAVLDNYVKQKAGDNYNTYNERGLTIYTYGGNAAWVNGGILYTIDGNAPLSGDQIRRIATSM